MKKHDPNSNHDGTKRKNTVLMDQHGRNVQHGPISNRAVTIKQRRVPLEIGDHGGITKKSMLPQVHKVRKNIATEYSKQWTIDLCRI